MQQQSALFFRGRRWWVEASGNIVAKGVCSTAADARTAAIAALEYWAAVEQRAAEDRPNA
jgi:hypothetical protein